MKKPSLSILIPSIPERIDKLAYLMKKLDHYIRHCPDPDMVEVISLMDNKKISIGEKRDRLVQLATGTHLAFIDDDDDFHDHYVHDICVELIQMPEVDLIAFNSLAILNGEYCNIITDYDNENEPLRKDDKGNYEDCNRRPFHVCVWRAELAKSEKFKAIGYAEDWDWAKRVLPKVKMHRKIEKQLHIYRWDANVTQAPVEDNEVWQNPNIDRENE